MFAIKNNHLKIVYQFLISISIKGKKNIHRTRIANAIQEQHAKFAKEEIELLKEHCEIDKEGSFVRKENGNLDIKNTDKFKEQQEELLNEVFIIDDKNLESALKTVKEIVTDYNKELDGDDALAHFYLVEAFEKGGDKDESNDSKEE